MERPTDKQLEILQMISNGVGRKEIARRLHMSPHTVKQHTRAVLKATEAWNTSHAIAVCFRQGWLT